MTSNIGSEHLLDGITADGDIKPEARHLIASQGFDPVYGARPLRRYISHEVETRIGRARLGVGVLDGARILIDAKGASWSSPWSIRPRAEREEVCR